jgi:uncharacterized SAM-binding protein YcdF (DUF218 family)
LTATQQRKRRTARGRVSRGSKRPRRFRWERLVAVCVVASVVLMAVGALARRLAPRSNTSLTRFDAIIVLGYPADSDGNPTPLELASVTEAVREYERGVAPRLIFTGSAVANRYTEAQVMSQAAEAQGIPAEAVLKETHARDTIQNACYAARLMKTHGWTSAEVIANPTHLPRAALIFSHLGILWRMHPAPPLAPPSALAQTLGSLWEDADTTRYLLWARPMERCQS